MNCRQIPVEQWSHASQALLRYFSLRHGMREAEDLAQETLAVLWERDDFQFREASDFAKVCFGFARHIHWAHSRQIQRDLRDRVDYDSTALTHNATDYSHVESRILLQEVRRAGAHHLRPHHWWAVCEAAIGCAPPPTDAREANRRRVRLHRARQQLGQLTGWPCRS